MKFNKEKLVPYFQPIISIDSGKIYGYEMLGRYITEDAVKSLGYFFEDEAISSEERLEVDKIIRKKGLEQFAKHAQSDQIIFINIRLDWLAQYSENPEQMPTIQWAKQYGIKFSSIVIELTEEDYNDSYAKYKRGLEYYKNLGIKIAIDDYGSKSSDISRITDVFPDIIKIDMNLIHNSEQFYQYRDYLRHITCFCETLGIEVVYEGIENEKQLCNCIHSQGRFYQGFLLSKPLASIKNARFVEKEFKSCCTKVIVETKKSIENGQKLKHELDEMTECLITLQMLNFQQNEWDDFFINIKDRIPKYVERIYLCDQYGYQLTSNIEYTDNGIILINNYNKNWAWRGYLKNAMRIINENQVSYITKKYRDISSRELIRTYVRRFNGEIYLLIDVE